MTGISRNTVDVSVSELTILTKEVNGVAVATGVVTMCE